MDANSAAIQQAYAAWVQAIGSIVGIAVAIWVPYRQRSQEMKQRNLMYWSGRSDIERRISIVTTDVNNFVKRLADEATPVAGTTLMRTYYPTIHETLWHRIDLLEARDIGDSGHDRVAVMRTVLTRLMALYPRNGMLAIQVGSVLASQLREGPIAQDAEACAEESLSNLETARAALAKLGIKSS